MSLTPGTRFGPYEIVDSLGAGGMGEVYRARDARLGRDVAIKVLPPDVARDGDRRARFEREARAVAALSHPNILALHDIGSERDQLYLVSELLEGQTLAERIAQGPLPLRKAIEIVIAVARGLAAAHDKGIAHRDLKPANVFLLADGQVKILDFGLARPAAHVEKGATHTQAALTDAGTILGTAGYMAPEQVRGQPVDGRADLFALGVVLYETVTGKRPFSGDSTQAQPLPDTFIAERDAEGMQPAFSPDGRSLLTFLGGKLKRVSIDGGSPQTLADAPQARGATWGVEDQIVYQPAVGGPLYVVAASGGTPRPLPHAKPLDERRAGPRHPFFLPDGKHFLFNDLTRIYVASVAQGEPRVLVEASSRAEYASGRLLYVKDGSLMAQPFDAATQLLSGSPQRVIEKVGAGITSTIDFAFSASANGTLAYWEGRTHPLADVVWLDRTGRQVGTIVKTGPYASLSASSDMSRVATEQTDLQTNWFSTDIVDVQRGVSSRISVNQIDRVNTLTPMLSRDGRHVWFSAAPGIFRLDIGGESPALIGVNQGVVWVMDVSPDVRWLLYRANNPSTAGDIWALPLSGEPTPVPWLKTPAHEVFARFSPDGKWVAFVQRDAEGFAVYLDSFPARGHRQRVSPGGGHWPMWSADGTRLHYLTPDFRMMEVQIAATPAGLRVSPPAELFRAPTPNTTIERITYWPAPDGQRFLYIARQDNAMPRTINVVLNWPALVGAPVRRGD